jgi:hypothetical protein
VQRVSSVQCAAPFPAKACLTSLVEESSAGRAHGAGPIPICMATCRTAALSQVCPTASSKRLLYGALLGNCATFSARKPQRGHFTRYISTTTVVMYSKQGRSRTSRFAGFLNPACRHMLSAPRADQLQPRLLPPNPQLQSFAFFVNLFPINPISRPSQNARPVVFPHPLRLASDPI